MSDKNVVHRGRVAGKKVGKLKLTIIVVLCMLVAVVLFCGIYVSDYYEATPEAVKSLESDDEVTVSKLSDGNYLFMPQNPIAGLIFYPGGKVEHEAYGTLMRAYAKQGICCVLVEMPFKLAVLDMNAADGIMAQYPEINNWYMGGHSLGGSMAASYVSEHAEEFQGLILLASYSTADLSQKDLQVLSIYGSEDKVLNREKYAEYYGNLPEHTIEQVIEGGSHAYFGSYGEQEGDGVPTITREEQISETIQHSMELIME